MEFAPHFRWSSAGVTHPGRVRDINEDALGLRPEIGLWVVADGLGGHEAGDIASTTVVQALDKVTYSANLDAFVATAKASLETVNRELVSSHGEGRMGTTVVILLAHSGQCACLWVGDSRAYRLRNGAMHAMTRDHSYIEDLIEMGQISRENAEDHPRANEITRAVGVAQTVEIETCLYDLEHGDRYLLCSDGLYREVSEQELLHHMRQGSCKSLVDTLLKLALERGARDNVSIVAVDFMDR